MSNITKIISYLGAESSGSGNSVKVSVGVLGHVVVKDDVDALNVHSTAEQVCGNQNTLKRKMNQS